MDWNEGVNFTLQLQKQCWFLKTSLSVLLNTDNSSSIDGEMVDLKKIIERRCFEMILRLVKFEDADIYEILIQMLQFVL